MSSHAERQDHPPKRANGRTLEDRYKALFENVPVGLYITTPDGRIVDANPALIQMLGYPSKASLLGTRASDLYVNPQDREHEQNLFDQIVVVESYETQLIRRDGTLIWVRDTCRAVRDASGTITSYEGSLQDITAERESQEELIYMAQHDPLTGLFNRHTLRSILDSEIVRARRYSHPIGVLMIDVNHFKRINDRFGHAVGDAVLLQVADVLRATLRESDVPVRFGGDEFLVLLIETDGETEIVKQRLRDEMARRSGIDPLHDFPVSLAIGTAHWEPDSAEPIEHVLREADQSMYADKRRASQMI